MRIETLKPKRNKTRISSFKKLNLEKPIKPESKFTALLYRIIGDGSKYKLHKDNGKEIVRGSESGNLYAVIVEAGEKIYTDRHVSFSFRPATNEIDITYYKGFITRQDGDGTIEKSRTVNINEIKTRSIGKSVRRWLSKQKYHGFMLKVSFRTVFPGFENYSQILHPDSIGVGVASEVIKGIMEKCMSPVQKKNPKEIERFYGAFVSAKHMGEEVFYCKIMDLENENRIPTAERMMIAELGNQLYVKLTPKPKVLTQKDKVHEYFSTVFEFMRNFLREINPFNWIKI